MRLRIIAALLISTILLVGSTGCNSSSYGFAPWPVYPEGELPNKPEQLSFSENEKAILIQLSRQHPDLFKRLQAQAQAYENYGDKLRKLVDVHNKNARENNLNGLKTMGHSEASLRELLKE